MLSCTLKLSSFIKRSIGTDDLKAFFQLTNRMLIKYQEIVSRILQNKVVQQVLGQVCELYAFTSLIRDITCIHGACVGCSSGPVSFISKLSVIMADNFRQIFHYQCVCSRVCI